MRTGGWMMRRGIRILLKTIGAVIIAAALFMAVVFTINIISNKSEQGKIEPYGQLVPVDGKQMNVLIQGTGEETIVLLPGYGTGAPALDFKPLIDELSPFYKVVAVEPFGYGLSDGTEKERTNANIVSELHEALQQLGIQRYTLMGHSIAGIYGLEYVNQYQDEVSAFVGIDSSVPTQGGMDEDQPVGLFKFLDKSGLMRVIKKVSGDPYAGLPFDDLTKEQMRLIANKNSSNDTTMNEMEHFKVNFASAQALAFPKDLPLLLFVQDNNTDVEGWMTLHEGQVKDSLHGRLVPLEGGHYLHHTRSKEIVQDYREFMDEVQQQK
ncbi:alpha/beta hydrolase [Paenibacillus sp. MMS20-IR301]|uniref:alpha/beta hydrolase n=1 Tax=Paenibacillus sp. MMS20-IR301 TaxID=2895946 RepID=UPI0028E38D2C|nr:alpha/beta hydrolase [Paenibacillus sp. MMS20-IR301]WNS41380.1 alpha/beta hydrolase [Paenibacillus sp. MMS20-IR301]